MHCDIKRCVAKRDGKAVKHDLLRSVSFSFNDRVQLTGITSSRSVAAIVITPALRISQAIDALAVTVSANEVLDLEHTVRCNACCSTNRLLAGLDADLMVRVTKVSHGKKAY